MGHERVGVLPRTRHWRDVVEAIGPTAKGNLNVDRLAEATLSNVRARYSAIHDDSGVQAAFGFLVALSSPAPRAPGRSLANAPVDLGSHASALGLVRELQLWVRAHASSRE